MNHVKRFVNCTRQNKQNVLFSEKVKVNTHTIQVRIHRRLRLIGSFCTLFTTHSLRSVLVLHFTSYCRIVYEQTDRRTYKVVQI